MSWLQDASYFAVPLTLGTWLLGTFLSRRLKTPLVNPILFAALCTGGLLLLLDIPCSDYQEKASSLSWLLTPATVCLAIPLYEQLQTLKKQWKAVLGGIFAGTLTSVATILLLCLAFSLSPEDTATLLPKSVTTAIALGISEELGGLPSVTAAVVVLTGILGNMFAPLLCRLLRLEDPTAKGVAIGTSSHAIGTARALEMGTVEGAMSGLSIAVAGVITVVLAPLAMKLL